MDCPHCGKTLCNKYYVSKHAMNCKMRPRGVQPPIVIMHVGDPECESEGESEGDVVEAPLAAPTVRPRIDINEFVGHPCVYIFHLGGLDYKFGVSGEIDVRTDTHMAAFSSIGCAPMPVKYWRCASMQIMKDVEMKIKRLARGCGMLVQKYGRKEIITTDDIAYVCERIDHYVGSGNDNCDISIRRLEAMVRVLEAKRQLVLADNEGKRLDLELLRM